MRKWLSILLAAALVLASGSAVMAAPASRSVVVTVVGSHGEPLDHAAVQVMTPGSDQFRIEQTGAGGEATISLPDGFSFWIRAWAKGHAVMERPYVPATDGPVITLTAVPYAASLVGMLSDELGRPVKNAKVTAWLANLGLQGWALTGEDGSYLIEGLQARDTYVIQVEAAGYQPFIQTDVTLAAGARNQVDAALTPATAPVSGEVINSQTNRPANGVTVELILNGWGVIDHTVTDTYGYFYFAAPTATGAGYQVRLSSANYETYTSAAFAVNPGAWVNFSGGNRIALNPLYAELSGSVVDQGGNALARTTVELQRSGLGTIETGVTNERGFFLFSHVPAGTYRVRALPGGGQEQAASAWVALAGGDRASADVSANLPDTQSFGSSAIVGTVLDHLGNPVSGAEVTATRGGSVVRATTDAQGQYRLGVEANIEDGANPDTSSGYRVAVTMAGFLPTDQQQTANNAAPPAMVDVRFKATNRADFTLQPATAQVAGRVLSDRGLPLSGVSVSLVPEGSGTIRKTTTDAAGRYVFADLPVGKQVRVTPTVTDDRYFVSAMTPDGALIAPVTVDPGSVITHSLTVRPLKTVIRGEVRAGTDQAAAGATVTLVSPADGKVWNAPVSSSGAYSLAVPAMPGRQYLVRTVRAGALDGTASAAVDPGANYGAVVNLAVVAKASIIGRVYTPEGKPAANTGVTLWADGEAAAVARVTTDAQGFYRFDDLTPGRRYNVAAWWDINNWSTMAPGEAIITPLLSPGPGSTIRADLQAPAGGEVGR